MNSKKTDDLRTALKNATGIESFLNDNAEAFTNPEIGDLISAMISRKKISKAAVSREAGMSEIYLHQIIGGKRNPSRNRLLCICLALEATPEETQELLKKGGYALLYIRSRRDSILMYALLHQLTPAQVNDLLFTMGEEVLS